MIVNNAEEHFRARASSTPLLVGAKGSQLELVLSSLYFDGVYDEFDWRREFGQFSCITFDGRYPPLNSEDFERPLAGSLSYSMISSGFLPLFGNDTLQLRIQIKDRALNISNIVESQDFVVGQ